MPDRVMLIPLRAADPLIQWPARGGAETELCGRDGWERREIPTVDGGRAATMAAMCRGELAVNRMLGGDEGFAISLAASGFRISFGGAVFARSTDAMVAAEAMLAACGDWTSCETADFGDHHRQALRAIIKAAERRGEIMLDRVYPT
jgi:hypothetical protein